MCESIRPAKEPNYVCEFCGNDCGSMEKLKEHDIECIKKGGKKS